MPFDYNHFCKLAKIARDERTVEAALPLLNNYADSGCALYPADVSLFAEVFGVELPGFELVAYTGGHGGFTARRTR